MPTLRGVILGKCVDKTINIANHDDTVIDKYVIMLKSHTQKIIMIQPETGELGLRTGGRELRTGGRLPPLRGVILEAMYNYRKISVRARKKITTAFELAPAVE